MTIATLSRVLNEARDPSLSVSVIVLSYNYADFVGSAIDSALDLDWPSVEVIVVDDGSTDGSRDIIASYGTRVIPVFKTNGGHCSACQTGFAKSTGEVVFFLDSDDLLHPGVVNELVRVWRPGISKVQFQMQIINAQGDYLDRFLPQFKTEPTSMQIRTWVKAASAYPTPPGSGNAYSRAFLSQIFPLPTWFDDNAGDSACLSAAPFLGDIVTIMQPLVAYRVHGRNQSAMLGLDIDRLQIEVSRAYNRFAYSKTIAEGLGLPFSDNSLTKSLSVLPYRVASWRLKGFSHPYFRDNTSRLMLDTLHAAMTPQGVNIKTQLILVGWIYLVLLCPTIIARKLVSWRFVPASRPKVLTSFLRKCGILK